jgi:DNA gyrase subunit A
MASELPKIDDDISPKTPQNPDDVDSTTDPSSEPILTAESAEHQPEEFSEPPIDFSANTKKEVSFETPEGGRIVERSIVDEMKTSYIDYSMSVIVSRALPDVRDGLKPSQRRILVVLNDLGLLPNAKFQKSAKICGYTTGNYHPHGESIVYPTMVKLAQDFNTRYLLVDGQGNFGTVDGDPPAQMRYTEARMTKYTQSLLKDIEKGTVQFVPTYDSTNFEPTVLPSSFPNLLCNGAEGIAVGMATKIPPHNLREVVGALTSMIDKGNTWKGTALYNDLRHDREKLERIPHTLSQMPKDLLENYMHIEEPDAEQKLAAITARIAELNKKTEDSEDSVETTVYPVFKSEVTIEELMNFIPGPDFPTWGQIYDRKEILNAYATGRGRILMRAKASIIENKSGRFDIIITEIPYQVNKAHLVEKIAELVKTKRVEGITALRDESNREGMRIVVELKKAVQPKTVLNKLFKYTEMQKAFNANMIALVDGQPRTLTIKQILEHFLSHRLQIVIRRYEFDIAQAKYRGHILEGLKIALDHLDEIIATIRASKTQEEAKDNLIKKFDLTEVQSQAILDLPLRRLAALERQKIEDEYNEVLKSIEGLEELLGAPDRILLTIKDELNELKDKMGDDRKTKVFKGKVDEIEEEDLVAAEDTFVTISNSGYIKRMPPDTYKVQNRGGKGIVGATTKEDDYIVHAITCNTHDTIVLFTTRGKAFEIRAFEIPEYGRQAKGIPIVNLVQLEQDERVTALLTRGKAGIVDEDQVQEGQENAEGNLKSTETRKSYKYLFMATQYGTVKKTELPEFDSIRANGLVSIKLDQGDSLKWVRPSTGEDDIILISKYGRSLRFHEKDVRPTGRNTRGVRGIAFKKDDDELISMDIIRTEENMLMTISENGYGKMTKLKEYPRLGRARQGVFTFRVNGKTGNVVVARIIDHPERELVLISRHGQVIRSSIKQIPHLRRQTSGVRVMRLNKTDTVAALAFMEIE